MTAASQPRAGVPPVKREAVAALVRDMIADGTLRPDDNAPSSRELAAKTGFHYRTCQAALRFLLKEGLLVRGMSDGARLRVAGAPPPGAAADSAAALSASLAARRNALSLTQLQLAGLLGVSLTTIGHAETGRLWHSLEFWERADAVLDAGGELLRLHDEYKEAGKLPVLVLPIATVAPDSVRITWADGTETLVRPP